MFNLDEALRNHLAQRQKEPKVRFVAGSVATLSPRSNPGRTRVVAVCRRCRHPPENYHLDDSHHSAVERGGRASLRHRQHAVFSPD